MTLRGEWRHVLGTHHWTLHAEDSDTEVRHILEREALTGEPNGRMYDVTGEGHGTSSHASLDEAIAAAEASLG